MTADNGLSAFVSYAAKAADAVAAQKGDVPTVTGAAATSTGQAGGSAGSGGSGADTGGTTAGGPPLTGIPNAGAPIAGQQPKPKASASASPKAAAPRSAGTTTGLRSALAAWALPTVLLIGFLAAVAGVGIRTAIGVLAWWRDTP
jgi:hypothetical protein